MIVYSLKCELNHRFDAWFQSGSSFDNQQKKRLLECPHCGSTGIVKAPMAPRISRTSEPRSCENDRSPIETKDFPFGNSLYNRSDKTDAVKLHNDSTFLPTLSFDHFEDTLKQEEKVSSSPALVRKALLSLRENIRKSCDDVGSKFPEEARRIHYGETKKRSIYGQASYEEILDLRQEGVEVSALPPFPKEDA